MENRIQMKCPLHHIFRLSIYQSYNTMEQLFFITCDERISKLLKYTLNGRGIELCELLEADFM